MYTQNLKIRVLLVFQNYFSFKNILLSVLFAFALISCNKDTFVDKSHDPVKVFDVFWQELDRNYSFFDDQSLNWDSIHTVYKPQITSASTEVDLFRVFTKILDLLQDAHTNLYTQMGATGNVDYFQKFPLNQIDISSSYFDTYHTGHIYEYGMLKSSQLAYLKIKTFEGAPKQFDQIDSILTAMKAATGLIIDVRSNRGGLISNSLAVVSRFTDSTRVACKYRVRNGPNHQDFSNWQDVSIHPSLGNTYQNPVVILTNRTTFSSAEWFVMFTSILPNTSIVGDTTGGGSAIPILRELPNSWALRISNTQTMLPTGADYQFTGLYPNYPIWISTDDEEAGVDAILEKAISILSK